MWMYDIVNKNNTSKIYEVALCCALVVFDTSHCSRSSGLLLTTTATPFVLCQCHQDATPGINLSSGRVETSCQFVEEMGRAWESALQGETKGPSYLSYPASMIRGSDFAVTV